MDLDQSVNYDRLNGALEEVAACHRRGERPALQTFLDKYPDLADELCELWAAMAEIEQVKAGGLDASRSGGAIPVPALRQLGDFRILREVGRGGMGVVYEAEQESLGRRVALKVLSAHALLDPRQLLRFQREARAAARLHHTNIVPVFGNGEHDGLHYYVMQFIHGQGLDQVLEELRRLRQPSSEPGKQELSDASAIAQSLLSGVFASAVDGAPTEPHVSATPPRPAAASSSSIHLPGQSENAPLSDTSRQYWESVARIGIQVAEALAYAHAQGTLHRDIKPSNLLLDPQGTVWVTDFGLAKASDSEPENLTRTGDVVGTLRYMAPERFQGKGDPRSDLYALGLTLYELLTLKPAYQESERSRLLFQVLHEEPPRPRKRNPLIPHDLETIVLKAIARDPEHRYQSAAEMAEDLKQFVADKPIRARRVSDVEKAWRWCRRNPSLAILLAALALALIGGTVGTSWQWWLAARQRDQATSAKADADRARSDSHRVLADVMLDRGITLAEQGEAGEGLVWMLEALKVVPDDAADLERVIRTNLATWMRQTHRLAHFDESARPVERCAFHPDGSRFVTASSDDLWSWAIAGGPPRRLATELTGRFAFTPDGKNILAATHWYAKKPAQLQLIDADTGKPAGPPIAHPRRVTSLVMMPDGKRCITGCEGDGVIRVWDPLTGQLVSDTLRLDKMLVFELALSPDGKTLAAAATRTPNSNDAASIYLFDLARGGRIGGPMEHNNAVQSIAFSPDGKSLLSASQDGIAQRWDARTGQRIGPPLRHPHGVSVARFTPDGLIVATGGHDGVVRWWDAASGEPLIGALSVHKGRVRDLAFSPHGRTMVTASGADYTGALHVWDLARAQTRSAGLGKEMQRAFWIANDITKWHSRRAVVYSPDATRVLTWTGEGCSCLTDAATGAPVVAPLRSTWSKTHVLAYSPDGRLVATASEDTTAQGDVRLWDAVTGRQIGPPLPHVNWVSALAFSPDSKVLVTGGFDCAVHFWDTATARRIGPYLRQKDIVLSLAFSPDGKTLAASHAWDYSGANGVAVFDAQSRKPIGRDIAGPREVVCFSPDGTRILAANDSLLQLWDVASGAPVAVPMRDSAETNAVAFSPDGATILTGSTDGAARIWDVATGKPIGAPMRHRQRINAVAFSPHAQGQLILIGCADGSARIWDAATRKPLGPPVQQSRPLLAIAFTPAGDSFLTTSADGQTRRWTVPMPLADSLEQLTVRLQVHTGLEMGPGQTVVRLTAAEWRERVQKSAAAEDATGAIGERAHHDARARDAEQDAAPFAIRWHLDRLIAADFQHPAAWLAYARRAHAWELDGELELADADYHQALTRGSAADLLRWYQFQALECRKAKRWPIALWYLDRALALAPDDWQLYADRALVHQKLGHATQREADVLRAAKGADGIFLARLADEYASRGQWDKARGALASADERGPTSLAVKHRLALALLKTGDSAGYRRICARVLEDAHLHSQDNEIGYANRVAWICALGPHAVNDFARPIALAERALADARPSARPDVLNTLGAVLYRAGRYQEAIARLRESIQARKGSEVVHDSLFLSMAHQRLGEAPEAGKYLGEIAALKASPTMGWDRLEVELLHNEAKAIASSAHR